MVAEISNIFCLSFRECFRYHAVLMRERFDKNKEIKDMRIAHKLVEAGEHELFMKQHPQPIICKCCSTTSTRNSIISIHIVVCCFRGKQSGRTCTWARR